MSNIGNQPGVTPAQDAWVKTVLGIEVPGRANLSASNGAATAVNTTSAAARWRDAKDRVDTQINQLRKAFMASGHHLAKDACERGLGAVSGGMLVRFQAAVLEYDRAAQSGRTAAHQKLQKTAAALSDFIASSKPLSLLERNPFGVPVTIRADVKSAISDILAGAQP